MKTRIFFKLIVMMATVFQTYAMQLAIFPQPKEQYVEQVLPNDAWDKIITHSSFNIRKNLKETCKQLAFLTSIDRFDTFILHGVNINNKQEKSAFIKTVIKTSNPHLIPTIIRRAHKEAKSLYHTLPNDTYITIEPEESVITSESEENFITLSSSSSEEEKKEEEISSTHNNPQDEYIKTYTQKHYLDSLLKEALKQENVIMIDIIKKENINTKIIKNYENQKAYKRHSLLEKIFVSTAIGIATTMSLTGIGAGITFAILTSPLCFYNATQHCITFH